MNLSTINAWTSSASRLSGRKQQLREFLLLFFCGVLLAGFHQASDLSLGLPGHFGLVWMAAIVFARAGSTLPYAAIAMALGYAGGGATFGAVASHAIGQAPGYLVSALAVDGVWRLLAVTWTRPVLAGLFGGLAFACKPLVMVAMVALFDIKAGSLHHGLAFPLLTHFCFGATGAVLGAFLWQGIRCGTGARPPT